MSNKNTRQACTKLGTNSLNYDGGATPTEMAAFLVGDAADSLEAARQILATIPDAHRYSFTDMGRWRSCQICCAGEYVTDRMYDPHKPNCPWNYMRRLDAALKAGGRP